MSSQRKRREKTVEENKSKVNKALKNNKKINVAVNIRWPFIGPFLAFLEKTGVMNELKKVNGSQIRKGIALHIFILLYTIKIIIGIPNMRGSEALLGDAGIMKLIGFNIDEVMNGTTKRGKANQHGKGYKKNSKSHECIYAA